MRKTLVAIFIFFQYLFSLWIHSHLLFVQKKCYISLIFARLERRVHNGRSGIATISMNYRDYLFSQSFLEVGAL